MTRRSWAFDGSIVVLVFVLGQLEVWLGIGATQRQGPAWAQATGYALAALALSWRRVHPFATLVAIAGVLALEFAAFGSPEGFGVQLPVLIAAYSQARWDRRHPMWWGLPVVLLAGVAWIAFDPLTRTWPERLAASVWVSVLVIAWLVGALVRSASSAAENRRLARSAEASRALAEERNLIARELHDAVGHSVSVMTMQAAAVRRRLTADQAAEREALESVERVGREAMAEMRRLVSVLRHGGGAADREPPASAADVPRLVDGFRAAGLAVDLALDGDVADLPPGVGLAVFRVVQEGLTNVVRHAPEATHVSVVVDRGPDHVTVAVRDDGDALAETPAPGHGITGMRERVALYGGSVDATATPQGFALTAVVPLEAP
ncbi:sensor histidine kinase [Demequina sp. SYSU T00192]|uniref:histidine kinase n=1 Tax=Demequina litoralis TaxID=3051660 RepID=A0ABT8GAG8_9MICO|nr:sensor histidine kinase [Demequina sp. SYSU T00192]MDN4476138.1 sensor histidine kinase [Demequina sp. SYSU T00192]